MAPLFVYRITHIQNLSFIFETRRIVCPNHTNIDPNYSAIGNNQIISSRNTRAVPGLEPKTFKDFIGFYFGKRSIMLYNIHTGYGEVNQVNQREIVYLVYDISQITEHGYNYFFTDGHAMQHPITRFFNSLEALNEVNLLDANATDFSAAADIRNPGLKRRKQAEFHIENEIDLEHIHEIVVYGEDQLQLVKQLLQNYNIEKNVRIDASFYF